MKNTNAFALDKKDKIILFGYCVFVFVLLFTFYAQAHPMVIFNTDDWMYISYARKAVPKWGAWNPAKVLPEILMPLCTIIGRYFIMPVTKDYIGSLTFVFNIVMCLIIVVYVYYFIRFMMMKFQISLKRTLLLALLFLLFHFLIFRNSYDNNTYMFYSENVTYCFNYTVPSLLNIIMLFYLEIHSDLLDVKTKDKVCQKGMLLAGLYLCIFSNLFSSYILAIYAGIKVLYYLLDAIKQKKFVLKQFLLSNMVYGYIIILWAISAVFELNGGRAGNISFSVIISNIKIAFGALFGLVGTLNRSFALVCFVVLASAIIIYLLQRKKSDSDKANMRFLIQTFWCVILSSIYLVLLCSSSVVYYIVRPDAILGMVFFGYMLIFGALAYILNRFNKVYLLIPLLIVILFFDLNRGGRTFKNSYYKDLDAQTCIAIDNDIIEQMMTADKAGLDKVDLHLPVFPESDDNWPLTTYGNERFSHSLYRYGLISREMEVTIILDESKNADFGMK